MSPFAVPVFVVIDTHLAGGHRREWTPEISPAVIVSLALSPGRPSNSSACPAATVFLGRVNDTLECDRA